MQLWMENRMNCAYSCSRLTHFHRYDICGFFARGSDHTNDESVRFLTLDRVHVMNGQLSCCQFNLLFLHHDSDISDILWRKPPKKQLSAVESFKIQNWSHEKIASIAGKSIVVKTQSNAKLSPRVIFEATNVSSLHSTIEFCNLMHFPIKSCSVERKKNCQKIAQVKGFHHALAKGCLLIQISEMPTTKLTKKPSHFNQKYRKFFFCCSFFSLFCVCIVDKSVNNACIHSCLGMWTTAESSQWHTIMEENEHNMRLKWWKTNRSRFVECEHVGHTEAGRTAAHF